MAHRGLCGAKLTLFMIKTAYKKLFSLLPKTRKSNPVSKMLRPLFEGRKFKSFFGVQMAGFAVVLGLATYPAHAFNYANTRAVYVDGAIDSPVVTETSFVFPLDDYGVSQEYQRFHPGIDLTASVGAQIKVIDSGVVAEVKYFRYGYGHYVRVVHERGYESLYAHMGRVGVSDGDKVEKDSVIGEIGLTGWTTGPHLHFELIKDGRYVNPWVIFE